MMMHAVCFLTGKEIEPTDELVASYNIFCNEKQQKYNMHACTKGYIYLSKVILNSESGIATI